MDDPKALLIISEDASSCGIGAVLSHKFKEGNSTIQRPIMFASRTLSRAERSYSQLDREALAIMFAIKKFYRYILFRRFSIVTDHQPLVGIFKTNSPIPEHVPLEDCDGYSPWLLTIMT